MNITVEQRDDLVVLAPHGALDAAGATDLQERVTEVLERGERRLVVDCGRVETIGSAGIRLLLSLGTKLGSLGGALVLCAVGDGLRRALQLARCAEKFEMASDVAAAVRLHEEKARLQRLSSDALSLLLSAERRGPREEPSS